MMDNQQCPACRVSYIASCDVGEHWERLLDVLDGHIAAYYPNGDCEIVTYTDGCAEADKWARVGYEAMIESLPSHIDPGSYLADDSREIALFRSSEIPSGL